MSHTLARGVAHRDLSHQTPPLNGRTKTKRIVAGMRDPPLSPLGISLFATVAAGALPLRHGSGQRHVRCFLAEVSDTSAVVGITPYG